MSQLPTPSKKARVSSAAKPISEATTKGKCPIEEQSSWLQKKTPVSSGQNTRESLAQTQDGGWYIPAPIGGASRMFCKLWAQAAVEQVRKKN
jgi:hypothetical protein